MVLRDKDLPGHQQHAVRRPFRKDVCTCRRDSDHDVASVHTKHQVHRCVGYSNPAIKILFKKNDRIDKECS